MDTRQSPDNPGGGVLLRGGQLTGKGEARSQAALACAADETKS